ncbi:hypothetical protein L2E82_33059 [Cichorium intybus]|uniref:Uncharacterized protein n=1 Tax=Cichorium intybus TaxID=13427 RepID=A0ACB9BJ59_CICIN|nr:hypothetical protein L2E82_33059 [Cichorium intybus]
MRTRSLQDTGKNWEATRRVGIGESEQDQEADTTEIYNVGGDQETNVEVIGESEQEQEAEEGEIIWPCSKEKGKRVATSDVGESAAASSNGVDKVVDDEKTVENNEIYDSGNANKSFDEDSKLEGPNFQEIAHVEVNMEEGYNGDLGGDDRTDWTCGGQSILR